MMSTVTRICAVLIALGTVLFAELTSNAASNEEASVRAIPQHIAEGWNRGDGQAVAAVYADDGVLVAGHGVVKHGRGEIGAYHAEQFARRLRGTRLIVDVTDVRFLNTETAIIRTQGGILWPGETHLAPRNKGIQSFVVVKLDEGWRVVLFQNTRVATQSSA
jgi:uncharacterized protein (TIGR02246 family)